MEKIEPSVQLQQLILAKQAEHITEGKMLKEHFHNTYESLKPINIIKNSLKEMASTPDLKNMAVNAAIGLTTGYIAKKVLVGKSTNPLSKIFGLVIETIISNKASKNADGIKTLGGIILQKLLNLHKPSETA